MVLYLYISRLLAMITGRPGAGTDAYTTRGSRFYSSALLLEEIIEPCLCDLEKLRVSELPGNCSNEN
jgi:hypothetical protein